MGTSNYSDEFKRDSVHQIKVRGYPVREVSRRLNASRRTVLPGWRPWSGSPRKSAIGAVPADMAASPR